MISVDTFFKICTVPRIPNFDEDRSFSRRHIETLTLDEFDEVYGELDPREGMTYSKQDKVLSLDSSFERWDGKE